MKDEIVVTPDAASGKASPQPVPSPSDSGYRVRLELFEGPLDPLLHRIKKNEVAVRDIPIASVTEQYLAYVEMLRHLNLDVAGEFLVMAATLTPTKHRLLAPPL